MTVASQLSARTVLIVCYCVASLATGDGHGGVSPLYLCNEHHSCRSSLWASPVIFSDAACALVLKRTESSEGVAVYSRDSLSFGDDAGFEDPLMHFVGGASEHPAGTEEGDQLACYGMNSSQVRRYYSEGMLLNHRALSTLSPGYTLRARRIYTHQASPSLVEHFKSSVVIDPEKLPSNVRQFGNLVGPCTVKMLDDDVRSGVVARDDLICISVVGGGPERGALLVRLDLREASALTQASA
jgi:3-oxoacyl-[acyl-carrier-protein] synthase-3